MYVMIRVGQVGTVVGTHQGVNDNITMSPWSMFLFFYFLFFFRKKRLGGLSSLGAVLCCAVLCCAMMTDLSGRLESSVRRSGGVVDRFNDLVSSSIIYI